MRTLAEWLALQESVHPQSIDMGLERVEHGGNALQPELGRLDLVAEGVEKMNGIGIVHPAKKRSARAR